MKTILSIDFDVIMNPSIELYNSLPGNWDDRIKRFPNLNALIFDSMMYQKLIQYIIEIVPHMDKDKIHFVESHDQIISFINKDEEINLINIDHHHDWCYKLEDFNKKIEKSELNCGNWLKYLFDNEYQINIYEWIHGNNSMKINEKSNFGIKLFKDKKIEELTIYDFPKDIDELVICLSPEFVPIYYHSLYLILLDICNSLKKTHYDIIKVQKEE